MSNQDQPEDSDLDWEQIRRDADAGREPQLIQGQFGQRQISWQALIEAIEQEFIEEYADSADLREADTTTKRIKLLLPVVNYVLAVQSVQLDSQDKAALIQQAYSNLFGYGPLDPLFLDDSITTISLEGEDKAALRRGHGELEAVGPLFEDEAHLKRILRRLLLDAGADLYEDLPFVETGLMVDNRPVSLTVTTPLMAFGYSADIRLHPRQMLTLPDLVESGFLSEDAAALLTALGRSDHGLVIVGDVESGKTTLLSALLPTLPNPAGVITAERAGELRLPEGAARLVVGWPEGPSFGDLVALALERNPACIVLDELRSDEAESIAPLLDQAAAPRQIWSFRGPFDAKRLRSALSMLARRADMRQSEVMVHAMYARLPFIVTVWRVHGQIRLYSVAEWQFRESDFPDYVLLMATVDGALRLTGERPVHSLNLDEAFWAK